MTQSVLWQTSFNKSICWWAALFLFRQFNHEVRRARGRTMEKGNDYISKRCFKPWQQHHLLLHALGIYDFDNPALQQSTFHIIIHFQTFKEYCLNLTFSRQMY